MLSCQGSNLRLWLSNLNALHDHLQDTLPRGRFPEFWCEDDDDENESILLHYYSVRGSLFVPFVVGLVKEIARYHFELQITMERLQMQGDQSSTPGPRDDGSLVTEHEYTTWRISTVDPAERHKLTATVGRKLPGQGSVEDALRDADINKKAAIAGGCPFHTMQEKMKTHTVTEKAATRFWHRAAKKSHTTGISTTAKKEQVGVESSATSVDTSQLKTHNRALENCNDGQGSGFMSNENMKEIFPYHILVDQTFEILQVGNTLARLIGETSPIVGRRVSELFEIKRPVLGKWDWDVLNFEQTYFLISTTGPVNSKVKANLIKLSTKPKRVMLVIAPDAKNIQQLSQMQLTMSDLPLHTFQRDAIFLGEHMYSGIKSAHKLDKLSRKLAYEHKLSNTLLYSMLPRPVAEILRNGKSFEPAHHENVTLFFSDVVGFTDMCSELPPWDIVDILNRLYTVMDYLAAAFNLYKVETIGDAYMCCSGLPEPNDLHAEDVANFALAVKECVKLVVSPLTNKPIRLRIGVHTGACMSGVVGTLTPHYCLFGDMINTTSRHESTGEPEKIQCSNITFGRLNQFTEHPEHYNFTPRGLVDMKGKGKMFTYWLDSAGDNNPHVGTEGLEKLVGEVKEMLNAKTWKKRKYFLKRLSISTRNSQLIDSGFGDSAELESTSEDDSHHNHSSPEDPRVPMQTINIIQETSPSLRCLEEYMEDDLSQQIGRDQHIDMEDNRSQQVKRESMEFAKKNSSPTMSEATDDSAESECLLDSSYHHLQIQLDDSSHHRVQSQTRKESRVMDEGTERKKGKEGKTKVGGKNGNGNSRAASGSRTTISTQPEGNGERVKAISSRNVVRLVSLFVYI